jgi:hypothetical protein
MEGWNSKLKTKNSKLEMGYHIRGPLPAGRFNNDERRMTCADSQP